MGNLAFIDIEATSADPQRADIIEIAFLIKDREGKVVDHFHSLVKPTRAIPAEITELTGITDQMVENAPEFHAIAEKVHSKLHGVKLVAHKAQFDRDILHTKFTQLEMPIKNKCICTLELSKRLAPGMSSYSLFALCSFFGISLKKNHRALEDAEATEKLYGVLELLSGAVERKETYLPSHEREIKRSRSIPGVVTLKDEHNKVLFSAAVENIQKTLKQRLELNSRNKDVVSRCRSIHTEETGSLARAMLLKSKREKGPSWSLYSFKDKKGMVVVKVGKVHPKKKALLYFHSKKSAFIALKKIQDASKLERSFAYREGPGLDKSEIVKRNAAINEQLRKMKPELENVLIRSKTKVNGLFQYVMVGGNDRYATFEDEREFESRDELKEGFLSFKKLGPSSRRALELSIQFTRNQRSKTDVVTKLKAS